MSKPRRGSKAKSKELDPEKEALIEECEKALEKVVEERLKGGGSFEDYEKAMLEIAHEVVRRRLEKKLQSVADGFAERLAIDHRAEHDWHGLREDPPFTCRRHCPGRVTYHSLVGPLEVTRHTYRERHRSGVTHVPLELEAGLMERMTPALAKSVAIGYAYMPPRKCEELMLANGLRPPSRSTFDRSGRDLGAYAFTCNEKIEPLVRSNEVLDRRARWIVIGLDRTGVPMRHEEFPGQATVYKGDMRRSRPRPVKRAQIRGPVEWRMDYVGTVALFGEDKELLSTRKYRSPADAPVDDIVARMMADVRHALGQLPQLRIAVVQDGAPELWNAVPSALSEEPLVSTWTETLDWYHLDERLSKCLDLCTTATHRESQRQRWRAQLLERDHGVSKVLSSLRRKACCIEEPAASELLGHVSYIARNRARTDYASYRRQGSPIGSGITEGACKSLVGARAKRSGQRWSQRGLSAALHLRAIHESDRFAGFWSFFSGRYRANVVALGAH
jgi:hypothetical protein